MERKLGIPSSGYEYLNINSEQDRFNEFLKTQDFLSNFFSEAVYDVVPEIVTDNMKLEFINYGDTQLVYVLSTLKGDYTLLVGQPAIQTGEVKKEYDNLRSLAQNNPQVIVCPKYYYSNGEKEMYITPYLMQARCIASQETGWGVYIPEPFYRFEHFTQEEQKLVNTAIIANMIRLYDEKRNLGLASCKIGGGDFILERDWSFGEKDIYSTLNYMKLIAARRLLNINFETYIEILQKEFRRNTYYKNIEDRDCSILINHKSRIPMEQQEIECGIQLGLKLRK